jgi:hypothetical protein
VNLTLINLPGLTKVAVEGQPDSIVQDIENMVRLFIEKALINREWREYNLIMSKLWSAQPVSDC